MRTQHRTLCVTFRLKDTEPGGADARFTENRSPTRTACSSFSGAGKPTLSPSLRAETPPETAVGAPSLPCGPPGLSDSRAWGECRADLR